MNTQQKLKEFLMNEVKSLLIQDDPYRYLRYEEALEIPELELYMSPFDFSGEVIEFTKEEYDEVLKDNMNGNWQSLLSEIYINEWRATHESGRGKAWVSYLDVLNENFNQWTFKEFDMEKFEDENGYPNDDLNEELFVLFCEFIESDVDQKYINEVRKLLQLR